MPHFNECSQLIEGADKAQNEYWDILGDEKGISKNIKFPAFAQLKADGARCFAQVVVMNTMFSICIFWDVDE